VVNTTHELDSCLAHVFESALVILLFGIGINVGWLTECIVEFRETRASAKDLVVEVAVTLVASQGSHIFHLSNSFFVENCQVFVRFFELRIRTLVALRLDPNAD